jgi:hypothetical protein
MTAGLVFAHFCTSTKQQYLTPRGVGWPAIDLEDSLRRTDKRTHENSEGLATCSGILLNGCDVASIRKRIATMQRQCTMFHHYQSLGLCRACGQILECRQRPRERTSANHRTRSGLPRGDYRPQDHGDCAYASQHDRKTRNLSGDFQMIGVPFAEITLE